MNYGPTDSLRIPAMCRETFALNFSNGYPVPGKQGVRIFFPLSKFPGRKLVRVQVLYTKQYEDGTGIFSLSELSDISLTLVNDAGERFVDNAPAKRFVDYAPTDPAATVRRNLLFSPQALNARASYAMWVQPALVPGTSKLLLMFTYK